MEIFSCGVSILPAACGHLQKIQNQGGIKCQIEVCECKSCEVSPSSHRYNIRCEALHVASKTRGLKTSRLVKGSGPWEGQQDQDVALALR